MLLERGVVLEEVSAREGGSGIEMIEEGSEVVEIVTAEVEDCRTDLVKETRLTTTLVAEGGDLWCPGL